MKLRRAIKAYEENDIASFDEMRKPMASDVVLHQLPDLSFGGEYIGREEVSDGLSRSVPSSTGLK